MKIFPVLLYAVIFLTACTNNEVEMLFMSKKNKYESIYKMVGNGNAEAFLDPDVRSSFPVVSPDGSAVAYLSEDMGAWDIHLIDLASGKSTNITNTPDIEGFPAWSPDGDKLAFMSSTDGNRDIFTVDKDGSNPKRITTDPAIDLEPVWSQNKPNILYFKTLRNGYEAIFRKNLEDNSLYEISEASGANNMMKAVPNSTELSYVNYNTAESSFMTYDEVTEKKFSLLSTPSRITSYSWTDDGRTLAIAIKRQLEVYDYNKNDGLKLRFIIEFAAYPAFDNSSDKLLYVKRVGGYLQIFECDLDGNSEKALTRGDYDNYEPLPY